MSDDLAMLAVEVAFAAINRDNDHVRAIINLDPAYALVMTAPMNKSQPLHRVTFAVKDLIDNVRLLTSCGSRLFDPVLAARDTAYVAALESVGAVPVGNSNMHELAVGSSRNHLFGQVVKPLSGDHGTGVT